MPVRPLVLLLPSALLVRGDPTTTLRQNYALVTQRDAHLAAKNVYFSIAVGGTFYTAACNGQQKEVGQYNKNGHDGASVSVGSYIGANYGCAPSSSSSFSIWGRRLGGDDAADSHVDGSADILQSRPRRALSHTLDLPYSPRGNQPPSWDFKTSPQLTANFPIDWGTLEDLGASCA